jgi:uncharacterized membrane protein YbaN (DUF454 family)
MKKRIKQPHPVLRVIRLIVGILLVLAGLIGGLIPVLQGWMFLIPGLGLLAPESRHIRKLVVWLRARLRLRRFRKSRRRAVSGQRGPSSVDQARPGEPGRG